MELERAQTLEFMTELVASHNRSTKVVQRFLDENLDLDPIARDIIEGQMSVLELMTTLLVKKADHDIVMIDTIASVKNKLGM